MSASKGVDHIVEASLRAVAVLPYIDSMNQLFDLPEDTHLIADGKVWERRSYLLAQGMSRARNGELFTGRAKVLCLPAPAPNEWDKP
jgi:hypothetical protein